MIVRTAYWLSGDQNNVPTRFNLALMQAHDLAQASLDPISAYSVPNAAIDHKTKSAVG